MTSGQEVILCEGQEAMLKLRERIHNARQSHGHSQLLRSFWHILPEGYFDPETPDSSQNRGPRGMPISDQKELSEAVIVDMQKRDPSTSQRLLFGISIPIDPANFEIANSLASNLKATPSARFQQSYRALYSISRSETHVLYTDMYAYADEKIGTIYDELLALVKKHYPNKDDESIWRLVSSLSPEDRGLFLTRQRFAHKRIPNSPARCYETFDWISKVNGECSVRVPSSIIVEEKDTSGEVDILSVHLSGKDLALPQNQKILNMLLDLMPPLPK